MAVSNLVKDQVRSYFDALQFRFDQRYREGLTRYLAEAVAIDQLDHVPELTVFGEPS